MGILQDIQDFFEEAKRAQYNKLIKDAYQIGFQDGRLCPETLRPCMVDGQRCLFHRFGETSSALIKFNVFLRGDEARRYAQDFRKNLYCPAGSDAEILRNVYALVEYPDGAIGKVEPEKVRFLDREVGDD